MGTNGGAAAQTDDTQFLIMPQNLAQHITHFSRAASD